MRRVVLASGNAGKLRELQELLAGRGFEVLPQSLFGIRPPVEDGASFVENALLKARHAARLAGLPAIADDSGLEVDALGGRPGIHSARFAGEQCSDADNNALLLAELAGVPAPARTARYRCAVVYLQGAEDPAPLVATGSWEGVIGARARGEGGFGYDPLFVAAGGSRSVAEMSAAEKHRASHRGQALRALLAAIDERTPGAAGPGPAP